MSAYTWVGSEVITTTGGSSASYVLTIPSSLGSIQRAELEAASSSVTDIVFYTFSGAAPTTAVGKRLPVFSLGIPPSQTLLLHGNELEKMMLSGSTAGVRVHVDYFT